MKKTLYTFLSVALMLLTAVPSAQATKSIGTTEHYKICPGSSITMTTRQVVVTTDTLLYDTLIMAAVPEPDTIINMYDVNVYPPFEKVETMRIVLGDSLSWHDTVLYDAGQYIRIYHSVHGCDSTYRLTLETYQPVMVDTLFRLCDNETLTFHGRTYANAGEYTDAYTADTIFRITIVKYPGQLYQQTGTLDRTHPYYWQYSLDGELKTDTIYDPGVYEYTTQNPATGCNDTYRLILTRDETSFHFIETISICENEPFDWRGRTGLNKLGVGQTIHYFDRYRTAADQDSIYELILTVNPVLRTSRTMPFCGSIEWNGKTYTESTILSDTLTSIQFGCDSIITTILSKGIPVVHRDTISILSGETLTWHGQTITMAGDYNDVRHSSFGCDSTFMLHVTLTEPAHTQNTHSEWLSICQGDGQDWRGKTYYNSGTYYDTIKTSGGEIDSLYILYLTVHKTYRTTERVTFLSFPQNYREQVITAPGEYEFKYQSSTGCDSIITSYIDLQVYVEEQSVTLCPGQSHIWDFDGQSYNVAGTYTKIESTVDGKDSVIHKLHVYVHQIPETSIEATICKGQTYVFGDRTLTESNIYRHTFHTKDGCDSTVVLSLNVLSPDTTWLAIQRKQGDSYVWDGETIRDPGLHFHYGTNRFGCDSVSILNFTYNQIDTIEETLTICPNEVPFHWNGIEAKQSNHYTKMVQTPDGNYVYYSLHLTVRPIEQKDTSFVICAGGSVTFNGETYETAGHYRSWLSCDTLANVHVTVHQPAVYETYGTITDDHGFTWTFMDQGTAKTESFTTPGTYEYENPNAATGCNDIYRLILTKDESSYHFEESLTICEGDDFSWRGLQDLSRVTGTSTYEVRYETRAGKDSIYTLHLTVTPVERTVRTIVFCGETTWKGTTYTQSAVVYDTTSLATGCYSIERINLDKAMPFYYSESKSIPQGTVLHWHGQNITADGTYYDYNTTIHGCDSIYSITVTVIPAAPESNQYAEELSTCEGDTVLWRGKDIWRSGTYVDTVWTSDPVLGNVVDSIFTLHFTVWPAPKDTIYKHLYTCGAGASIRYQGKDYYTDQAVVENLKTIHGCDSIVKVFLHFNTALFLSDTVEIADTELPYTWTYRLNDVTADTVLTTAGTYNHITEAEGSCTNREQIVLIVYPTYLFELDTTVCEADLPFYWITGPQDHSNEPLQHTIGESKQYEYRYSTVNNTDSIFRLNLTIQASPKRTEYVSLCAGEAVTLENGKRYFNLEAGQVYRDTIYKSSTETVCDSIIYFEIYQYPVLEHIQTVVIQDGQSIQWNGYDIHLGGEYRDTTKNVGPGGCDSISILRVIRELGDERVLCTNDTDVNVDPQKKYPLVWEHPQLNGNAPRTLYTSGTYRDTVFDSQGFITDIYRMDLTVLIPYDTTIYLHGCENKGVIWRDHLYEQDTTFIDRVEVNPYTPDAPCDSVFHVTIKMDTTYTILINDTLREYELPLIIGRQDPDTIWEEGTFRHRDTTSCGCDSIIEVNLHIIPKLSKNDSTFICEDEIKEHPVYLGDTVNPWFSTMHGGQFAGTWEGKWHGVKYTTDTIVWDWNHEYFHHIIVRPSQKVVPEKTFYLCPDDSIQLFWPYDATWFSGDTTYEEHRPMSSYWTDTVHGITYANDSYTCDSVTIWHIKKLPLYHKDSTAHRLLGDSIWWGGAWRYYTGTYDSLAPSPDTNSLGDTCMYIYPLHLIMDSAYYFRDTVELCTKPNITYQFVWAETGHKQYYTVGTKDSIAHHFFDSLITYDRRDSIYDLCVNYRIIQDTLVLDTICEGSSYRFNSGHGTVERWLDKPGRYTDTLTALNGCDSIVTIQLYVRNRVVTTPTSVTVTDRELPYAWKHHWTDPNGQPVDSTESLRATGLYTFVMPNIHGCDSVDSLYFTVHQTHVFRDTIDVCNQVNKTLQHTWHTGYVQQYTTPLSDDTAYYGDTLNTRIKYDSIYVLCVNFHQTYETLIRDTICEGDQYRFDRHVGNETFERWLQTTGTYRDTIESRYGCDSVITLKLYVRDRVPVTHPTVHIPDTMAPYTWTHSWIGENGQRIDSVRLLTASGDYECHMKNVFGCDSIDSLTLVIHNTYRIQEDGLVYCYDQTPITWQNRNDITKTGDYEFRTLTHDGYDSIRYVHIEVLPILKTVLTDTICDGDSIRFGLTKLSQPRFLTQSGVYYDTLTSHQHGCDSIIELRLNVYPKFYTATTHHVSNTEMPYEWKHIQGGQVIESELLFAAGEYVYHFTTAFGCDSIDSLSLQVHQTYLYRDTVTICADETPYSWEGIKDIYTTGEYVKHLQTHDGYDSTHVRYVNVLPILHTLIVDTLCDGDSIRFGLTKQNQPRFLTQTGIYYDTLTSYRYGCDSIIELRLNVYPTYRRHEQVDVADTQIPYEWKHIQGGQVIETELLFAAGEYVYHFTTAFGCDSVDSLSLRIHQTYTIVEDTITICSDETPFTWCDKDNITETGDYVFHGQTFDHYDSIRTVHIDVWPVKYTTLEQSICRGHSVDFDGRTLTEQGTYVDTLHTSHGCDSIVTLNLTVHEPYYSNRVEHIIEGQEVAFFDTICKTTGTYYHYGTTLTGCDSTTVLQLYVHPLVDTIVTVCSTELPYIWVNKWDKDIITPLYTAGIYRNDTIRINGERMFYGLQLIVNEPTDTVLYREICEGDIYNFNGQFLQSAGEYRDTIRNANGCDSVMILHLNVLSRYYHTVDHSIFEGDSVEFEGTYYSQPGNYPVRYTSSFGCDSIVELHLTVRRLYDDSVTICTNELPLLWRNRIIYESGIYRDTTYADGKQVITGLKVNVLPITRAAEPIVFTMCEGDFYKFGNNVLTEQGTYYDTLTAANGCDSIVMLSLQVLPTNYQSEVRRIFEGDSALFNGVWYKESGVYEYREKNVNGCMDTYQMILTVLKSFNTDTTAVICDNELPFIWRGYEYNETGDYALPIAWTDSSRVVKTLHLTVNETFYGERNVSICTGDTFLYKGKQYYTNSTFMDTIPSQVGCDSIIKYIVSEHPTYDRIIEKHISDKEPYIFHERPLTQTGTYEWTGKTIQGCDSMEHLILTVHPSFFQSDTIDLCQSDSTNYPYRWTDEDGRLIATITQSGTYNDSVLTEYGFDSVHQKVVFVHPSYLINEQYEIGEGEVLKIHGKTISEPTVYLDTMRTVFGCDSIFHVVVNAKRTREFTWTKTICQNEYFEFLDGRKLTNTGVYKYVSQYKDSIVTLNLTVNPVTYSEKRIVVTDKTTSYIYDGKLYDNLQLGENLFTENYVNQYGCDSIKRFIICLTTHYSEWYPIPLCPGSEVKIDGRVLTEPGLYTFERRSRVTGEMDSLYRVEIYDAPAYEFKPDTLTICQGDSVEYAGKFFKKPGFYTIKLKTVDGCDSIYYLNLIVNPVYLKEETVKILDDEVPYVWEGTPYYMSGDYYRSWQVNECDDTHILHLTVVDPQYIPRSATICNGDSLFWRGSYYGLDGDYYDVVRDTVNKMKTIYTLHLETVYQTNIISAHSNDICADAQNFDIEFEYSGAKPTNYSIYFDALAKHEGFRDIINAPFAPDMVAHVDLPQYTEMAYNNHPIYVRPNKYTMRLVVDNGVCGQSSSNDIEIVVKYPTWIIEQHWDDVVAPLKKAYNGGFEFSEVDWYVNGALQPNNSLGYLHNDKLKVGDEVVMLATRKGENYSIPTCPLVIQAIAQSTTNEPILVYPTQAPRHAPVITIEAPQGGHYAVYSFTGNILSEGELKEEKTLITLPNVNGIYFIRTEHGAEGKTHKVILY